MPEDAAPLILGSRAVFSDGQHAKLTSYEVDEAWDVLNVVVSRGFFRWTESVRLPFTTATRWSETSVDLSCESTPAFAREIPPIAAPARPLSDETPVALNDSRIIGALVSGTTRKVIEMIVKFGGKRIRVPASQISFEGKTLHVTTQPETLPEHRTDEEIARDAWRLLSRDRIIWADEIRLIEVESSGGVLTLTGNVRRKNSREHAEALVSNVRGVKEIRNEIADDLRLETELGWALERAGVQRSASIYTRSALGEVVLYGHAASSRAVEDAVQVASRVPGVRKVTSRIEVGPRAAAA